MIQSTGFRELEDKMEETFAVHGVPDTITHDNGPCYNSSEWRKFAGKWGFKIRPCTPEHPQANGIAERFMQVLVKVVHTAIAMGQDPKVEVRRMLLNYRNTPHASTGKTPAELMIGRQIKTRIPTVMKRANRKKDMEARKYNGEINDRREKEYNKRKHARNTDLKKGDQVLIKQEKTTIKPPYDPRPYTVVEIKGTKITAERDGQTRSRNKAKFKKIWNRPHRLLPAGLQEETGTEAESEDELDIMLEEESGDVEPEVREAEQDMQEDQQQIMGRQAEDNRIRKESTSDSQEEQKLRKSTRHRDTNQGQEQGQAHGRGGA